jgi:hypothetical protein
MLIVDRSIFKNEIKIIKKILLNVITNKFLIFIHMFVINKLNIEKEYRKKSDRSVTQWETIARNQQYWNEVDDATKSINLR